MASSQDSFKYLLSIYCVYNWSISAEDSRGEERDAPCPHGMYRLVHSCLYLLIKSQENVQRKQFLLYNPSRPPPFLISEEKTHQLAQDICQKFLFGILSVLLFLEAPSLQLHHYSKSGPAKRKIDTVTQLK